MMKNTIKALNGLSEILNYLETKALELNKIIENNINLEEPNVKNLILLIAKILTFPIFWTAVAILMILL